LPVTLVIAVAALLVVANQLPTRGADLPLISGVPGDAQHLEADNAAALADPVAATKLENARRGGDRSELELGAVLPPRIAPGYRWPIRNARITQAFGPSRSGTFVVAGKRFHDGVDIASFCGDHIVAAHDGVVIAAGRHVDAALGWVGDLSGYHARLDAHHLWPTVAIVVVIDDGNGYRSIYAHFWRIVVTAGQTVRAGTFLGTEGRTGHASGCHLHFGLFRPDATARFGVDAAPVRKTHLPAAEIARVNPSAALPRPESANISWGWGARDIAP
jgi:murein DD-endopeptidase MepM/ murein hydrolase activator NlpD